MSKQSIGKKRYWTVRFNDAFNADFISAFDDLESARRLARRWKQKDPKGSYQVVKDMGY